MEKFYFFNSFLDTARAIEDDELRLKYLMAVAEYWLEWKESDDPLIKALMVQTKFVLDRSVNLSQQKSESMRGNQNAVKNFEKVLKQRKTDTNRVKQKKQEEEIEEEKEIEVEEENIKKEKNTKKKFLEFVLLTDDEYSKLKERFGTQWADERIDRLNSYIWSTWKRYKSHYFTILSWSKNDAGTTTHSQAELMKERERQRIREEAQEILNRNKNTNGSTIQNPTYNRRTDLQSR